MVQWLVHAGADISSSLPFKTDGDNFLLPSPLSLIFSPRLVETICSEQYNLASDILALVLARNCHDHGLLANQNSCWLRGNRGIYAYIELRVHDFIHALHVRVASDKDAGKNILSE